MFRSVLVVCSGNICRSPMAEALLRQALDGRIAVASAGVTAPVGEPADPLACEVMAERGVDISAHRARQVDAALLAQHDLVLTMDSFHDEWLHKRHPQLRGRVFRLRHWCEDRTVEDPYRMPKAAFELAFDSISEGVAHWAERLRGAAPRL